jgi:3-dehydro-L-gulonate 2-dehydrogenase
MKVTFAELKEAFYRVLRSRNITEETADECAEMFARTTESGVYSMVLTVFRVSSSS